MAVTSQDDTVPDLPDVATERRNLHLRSAALTVIALFVLGGLLGLYGVHAATKGAHGQDGLRVELTYPDRARPALAIPYELRISRPGGFDGPIEVSTTTSYLAAFDENGMHPDPASSTADGQETTWTFDPPEGDMLSIWLDTRIEPGVQWRRTASTTVRSAGDEAVLNYTTWIFP